MQKQPHTKYPQSTIEVVFWMLALSAVLFINISPQALRTTDPLFLIIFLLAILVVASSNFLIRVRDRYNKIFFSAVVLAVVFFSIFLFLKDPTTLFLYYYLPVAISVAMAFLVIVQPKSSVTILIAVCTFLLGEAFWNIHISTGKRLVFPVVFLRVYSFSLLTIFCYYLYYRQRQAQLELLLLNEKLNRLDRMKSEFVANVSHELRTPLTSIKNACALLKKMRAFGASAGELLDIIDSNVDRQSRLVENLLNLARIEKGKIAAPRALINTAEIARQVAASFAIQAKNKNIRLHVDIEFGIQSVYASADQMAEVYTNLIDNAIKYTPSGGNVTLKISNEKNGIKSIISDTGIGIKEEDLSRLFNRFNRLAMVSEYKEKGTGLGLAIIKEIIDSHGGSIWAESEVGKGSKFIFTIPTGLRNVDKNTEKRPQNR